MTAFIFKVKQNGEALKIEFFESYIFLFLNSINKNDVIKMLASWG